MYNKITQLLEHGNLQSITLDIFDTVLLRQVWPEDIQFLEVAELQVKDFRDAISPKITPYQLYSWRQFVRREYFHALPTVDSDTEKDFDLNLEIWFNLLVYALSEHYGIVLTEKNRTKLIESAITHEITHEKQRLTPNKSLINALQRIKKEQPTIEIFFMSDMYLTTDQITELLKFHGIENIFDGGISSTDAQRAKHSGKLFTHVDTDRLFGDNFSILTNLHIGDNRHSDVAMALQSGSAALLSWPHRLRRIRTQLGKFKLSRVKRAAEREEIEKHKVWLGQPKNGMDVLVRTGKIFALPLAIYLWHVGNLAKSAKDTSFLFISSEATWFTAAGKKLFPQLYSSPALHTASTLNRKTVIRACIWSLIMKNQPELMRAIANTAYYGEIDQANRRELYEFLLGKEFSVSEIELLHSTQEEFYKKLYTHLSSANNQQVHALSSAYKLVRETLQKQDTHIVICDVGWGGTVQMLLEQFIAINGLKHDMSGLYLGCHTPKRFGFTNYSPMRGYLLHDVLGEKDRPIWNAVLWEYAYTNKVQYEDDRTKLEQIHKGLQAGYEYFKETTLSPRDFFEHVSRPEIFRLLNKPTDLETRTLGTVRLDMGFVDSKPLAILDIRRPRWFVWIKFILRPKRSLKYIIQPNFWTAAYISYYRLFGLRKVLQIIGKIKRTNYI